MTEFWEFMYAYASLNQHNPSKLTYWRVTNWCYDKYTLFWMIFLKIIRFVDILPISSELAWQSMMGIILSIKWNDIHYSKDHAIVWLSRVHFELYKLLDLNFIVN